MSTYVSIDHRLFFRRGHQRYHICSTDGSRDIDSSDLRATQKDEGSRSLIFLDQCYLVPSRYGGEYTHTRQPGRHDGRGQTCVHRDV